MTLLAIVFMCLADKFGWVDDDLQTNAIQYAFIADTILGIIFSQ
jgi:hypothetical protein